MTDLVTLAEYKAYKGINSTNNDSKLATIIPSVSAYVKNYCGRTFLDHVTVSKIDSFDVISKSDDKVFLSEFPVIAISEVKTSLDGGVTQTDITDYVSDDEIGILYSTSASGFISTSSGVAFKSLEVTFTAGYTTLPEDMRIAVLDLVSFYLNEDFVPKKAISSVSKESPVVSVKTSPLLPAHIRRILEIYRL